MKKLIYGIIAAIAVDFYLFPVSFTFIPRDITSKIIIAAIGAIAFTYNSLQNKSINLSRRTLIAGLLSVVFSLWCYISITENNTNDLTYASYWSSFLAWMAGAYGVYVIINFLEGKTTLAIITKYLVIVCVAQCIIALLIDNFPFVDTLVSKVFWQATDYYKINGRLYGIGCALDTAGTRFAAVLLLSGHQIAYHEENSKSKSFLIKHLIGFVLITVIGSMIARTTTVGSVIALAYILFSYASIKRGGYISGRQMWFFVTLIILIIFSVIIFSALYNSSPEMRNHLRFGFEGFFNWVETGEFRTNSTDILMNHMWIWPENFHDWMIGTGRYGLLVWNTDIGYCNFVLYCGIIGFSLFAAYFIYVNLSLNTKFKNFYLLTILLITLQGIIWAKIATDIFLIDALLFCIEGDKNPNQNDVL